jgi:hypothetical protein
MSAWGFAICGGRGLGYSVTRREKLNIIFFPTK